MSNKSIIKLNGKWNLKYKFLKDFIEVDVPGSVYHDLLSNNLIPDPFVGDNQYFVRDIMKHDFIYKRDFQVSFVKQRNFLVCQGLDTITEIYINDHLIAETNNMHRTYRFDVTNYLKLGDNRIQVVFKSPIKYINERVKTRDFELFQASDALPGYPYIRKGSSMFGWDWGPQLPDAGIWRDIFIEQINSAHISDVLINQVHHKDYVDLEVDINHISFNSDEKMTYEILVYQMDQSIVKKVQTDEINKQVTIRIDDPKLWYPSGYGKQIFYYVKINLINQKDVLDTYDTRIGLRNVTVKQVPDEFGETFTVQVNGLDIFCKGANYIPEDNLLARTNKELTEDLLISAKEANHNMVRVWGGGIYPPNYFYDLCDELGLLVWQDLMFACAAYDVTDKKWLETTKHEIIDNLKRIRNHPSIALICGNNENDMAIEYWDIPEREKAKELYKKHYIDFLEPIVNEYYPNMTYWHSSPSSKVLFEDTNSEKYGDMHYWGVWHANEPITTYRKLYPRFMSEFGLQSFPAIETVKSFAKEDELNIFSYVMEQHQKNKTSNDKILNYIGKMFKYPKDFQSLLYVSQLIQAEGIRYGAEHWRRNNHRCMGILYWQLNDCWPVASWSSMDYYHRWKALHYHSKKFYQPILLSIEEEHSNASIHLTNDSLKEVGGTVLWTLYTFQGQLLDSNEMKISVPQQASKQVFDLSFKRFNQKQLMNLVLTATFIQDETIVSSNEVSFVPDKYLKLIKPEFEMKLTNKGSNYNLSLSTNTYAKYIEIKIKNKNTRFSDNYFHLLPSIEKTIIFESNQQIELSDIEIKSLFDSYS